MRRLLLVPAAVVVLAAAGCGGSGRPGDGSFASADRALEALNYVAALDAFYKAAEAGGPLRPVTVAVVEEAGKDVGLPSSQVKRDLEDAAATAFAAGCDACAVTLRREADNH